MLFASFTCWKLHKGAIKDKGTILNAGKVNVKRWYKIIKACIVKNRSGNFLDQSENWGLAKALSLHQWIEYDSRFPTRSTWPIDADLWKRVFELC